MPRQVTHVVAHELLDALERGASGGLLGAGHSWVAAPADAHVAPPLVSWPASPCMPYPPASCPPIEPMCVTGVLR